MPGWPRSCARSARRYRLAIVTSSEPEPFARTHARTGLLGHFELVLTRDHYAAQQARSRAVPVRGRAAGPRRPSAAS